MVIYNRHFANFCFQDGPRKVSEAGGIYLLVGNITDKVSC